MAEIEAVLALVDAESGRPHHVLLQFVERRLS
jgi:hypothetical protein